MVAEWMANGRRGSYRNVAGLTISRLIVEFAAHAKRYYVDAEGKSTHEAPNFKLAMGPLRRLYGSTPAGEFGPKGLRAVQQEMVRLGWCRQYINRQIKRLRRVFRWAVSQEMLPVTVVQSLETVEPLRKGKTEAPEAKPVKPVAQEWVEATLDHAARQVGAVARLQLYTGMRPGEVCVLRGCDLDSSGAIWMYKPHRHKTQHHGHERVIFFGPKAQEIVTPFLRPDMSAYLFSPIEAERERREALHLARTTPLSCGNTPGSNLRRRRGKAPGERYTTGSYAKAIAAACDAAFPPPEHLARQRVPARGRKTNSSRWETVKEWRRRLGDQKWAELRQWRASHRWHPNQLRHSAATFLRKQYGLDAARVVLGHRSSAVTEVYAEIDRAKASQIMGEVG